MAKKKKSNKSTGDQPESKKSIFERFTTVEIHRSDLQKAPYNPRKISPKAKKKLAANIQEVGLVMPIVWNKRTGNVVAGHQRLDVLDSLSRSQDYSLTVAQVDLSEKEEREQNVFLNNPGAMGEWDLEKLESLFVTEIPDDGADSILIDTEKTGFDVAEIYQELGAKPLEKRPELLIDLSEQLRKNREVLKKLNEGMVEHDLSVDCYCIVVFKDAITRDTFLDKYDLKDQDGYVNRYVDGLVLEGLLEGKIGPDDRTAA